MSEQRISEPFLPGEIILEELEAREWAQVDLAVITGLGQAIISDIISGKRSISLKYAHALAEAFGTSEELWLNLQNAFDLAIAAPCDGFVARRAKLYAKAPLREMLKRHWIEGSDDIEKLEAQVCRFFNIESIDQPVELEHAARKSDDYGGVSPAQLAWLMRARNLAAAVTVDSKYTDRHFDELMTELSPLKEEPEEIRHIPRLLSKYGIRFLVIEPLPQSKIDGACFWLNNHSPVIALSLRHNRIDNFWQSVCHELKHIRDRDGIDKPLIENRMVGSDAQPFLEKPVKEQEADSFAANFLVAQDELQDFIVRTAPYFSRDKVLGFAFRLNIHPGIVVGQLQHKNAIKYSHFRPLLVTIRHIIVESALVDGWSHMA